MGHAVEHTAPLSGLGLLHTPADLLRIPRGASAPSGTFHGSSVGRVAVAECVFRLSPHLLKPRR